MREATYNGLLGDFNVRGPTKPCFCGGMKKTCYKWRELGGLIYKVMPCHGCSYDLWKKDPHCADYLEHSATWVDIPVEEQRARLERELQELERRRVLRRRQMSEIARSYLAEEPAQEATERPNDEVPDVQ